YFQTVPNDALEKMIWAEADKLGWFINTVTEPVLAKEKQVVKNEKRLRVDNRPYGHEYYVIDQNLYPEDHPYNWQVIGSLEDLQNAELADVKEFFSTWYVPNNVTLAIAGDFDIAQARQWIDKYFGEIPAGAKVADQAKQPVELAESKRLYHEDNFARLPKLTMSYPTVYQNHPDMHALDVLTQLLADGKKAPLNKVLIDEQKLTSGVGLGSQNSELAGQMYLSVRAFDGVELDKIYAAVNEGFGRFETEGFTDADLSRIKAGMERQFYEQFGSALGKAFTLAQYHIYAGDAAYVQKDLENLQAVTREDVMRVYRQYIKGKPYVATSFVPKDQLALVLSDSEKAEIVEEVVVQGSEEQFDASIVAEYEPTPSGFDRSKEPAYGEEPSLSAPTVWLGSLANGLEVYGIENSELPLVEFSLVMKGGQLLDDPKHPGVSYQLARSMMKGTSNRTTAELEEAIESLGSNIMVSAGTQSFEISATTLTRNFAATVDLVTEILLEPRWDAEEFETSRRAAISRLQAQKADPDEIADLAFRRLVYGDANVLSGNILGSQETLEAMSIADLQAYYQRALSPSIARLHLVGDVTEGVVMDSLTGLAQKWQAKPVSFSDYPVPAIPEKPGLYFVDVPGAKQSVLQIGYPALARTDDDFYPATVANYRFGGGGFASELTQQLREGKGYTYGIGSRFSGTDLRGPFSIGSNVRTNVTLESIALIREILSGYGVGFDDQDLDITKGFLLKSQARAFETMGSKLRVLQNMSAYGWPADYAVRRQDIVRQMTVEEIQRLATNYLDPNRMIYLVVGDAASQLERLNELGIGEVTVLE
ncbi:MAG: insulinase family protein, partial [Gammaproteobacteria bacterium]|nr:insulinase family protein [Gammaproteobacteria bacterium]